MLAWDVPVGELAMKLMPVSRADLEREHQIDSSRSSEKHDHIIVQLGS